MIRRLVPSGCWAAAALLVLAATSTIDTSAAAAASASALAQPPGCPAAPDLGTAIPVLLVHGFGEGPGVWSEGAPSMAGAIGAIPGVKVVSFDYKAKNTQWVTNHLIGACLATWITSLAGAAGGPGKVIIVAHSMGGLAVRCAVDPKCVNTDNTGTPWPAADAHQIRLVITLGTPNTGSFAVTAGGKLTSAGRIACPAILALKISPNLPQQPCPDVLGELFGGNSPAAQAMEVGPDGKPSKALSALPPLPSTIALDAIAGQITTTTTSLFGNPPFLVSGPNFPGDLIVSPASALDGAPPTSPAHPGTSTPHPGPGSGAVTIPCGTMSILSLAGLPDAVIPHVTCWHLTETTDTAWQAAVITAIRAAAAALAAELVTARLPVVSCPTSLGIAHPAVPLPRSRPVAVPQALATDLSVYADNQGVMELLGPKGWSCTAAIGADGSGGVTVYPAGAGPSSPVAITGSETSACVGCTLAQACPLFPAAATALRSTIGEACPARPPAAETVGAIARGIVAFEDPPGVKGDGRPSGGQYPANGVMTYHPSAQDGSWQETCTLPASEKDVCTAVLNTFVSWYGQR